MPKIDGACTFRIEFRNESWFTDDTFKCLDDYNLATVNNDSPHRWPATKKVTGDTMYVRFHGSKRLYRSSYTDAELQQWRPLFKRTPPAASMYTHTLITTTTPRRSRTRVHCYDSCRTDKILPDGSLNQAMSGPMWLASPRAIPLSSCCMSG